MSDFNNHDRRDAWKKMSEWSHSIPDEELNDLFTDQDEWDEWGNNNLPPVLRETRGQRFSKFVFALFGLSIGVALVSFVLYQLVQALGVTDLTFREAVIVTVCVAFIRYTDAGVMKQIR
jgi:hypothetical protein